MYYYIEKISKPTDMEGTAKKPSANHLFTVSEHMKNLLEDKAQFHHPVATLLYLCTR